MQHFKNKCSLKIFQMIGLIDGVRLYNDLHMKPLAPRLTLYIAQVSGYIWLTLVQCWGSLTFWCWFGYPHLWLMDPDLSPTPFSQWLQGCKTKSFFLKFFSYNLPTGTLSSVLKFFFLLLKFCVKILFCKHYFSPLNTFMRKGKDPDPDSYLWLKNGSGSGRPKNIQIRSRIPNTAITISYFFSLYSFHSGNLFFVFVILKNIADYTFFLLQKGDNVFHPILLQEVTVFEMMKIIAETFEVGANHCVLYLPKT